MNSDGKYNLINMINKARQMIKSCQSLQIEGQSEIFVKIDECIGEMHALLIRTVEDKGKSLNYSDQEVNLMAKCPSNSIARRIVKNCIQMRDAFFDLVIEEKEKISDSLASFKQIQSMIRPLKFSTIKMTNTEMLSVSLAKLSTNLNQLPMGQLKFRFQQETKSSQNIIEKKGLSEAMQNLLRENIQLRVKISEYEKKTELIEHKLTQLFELSKEEEKRHHLDKKLIDRICDNVFSQQFMIQANFGIRNEFHLLKEQNLKLKSQLDLNKKILMRIKNKKKLSTTFLNEIIKTRVSEVNFAANNWARVVGSLEQKIQDLKMERKKDQKIISNLQSKMERISKHKALDSREKVDRFKKESKKNNFNLMRPSASDLQNHHINLINEKSEKRFKDLILSPFKRTDERLGTQAETLSYSKSSYQFIQAPYQKLAQVTEGFKKFCSQKKLESPEPEQELKTSGFFVQPESQFSYYSNNSESNQKQSHRRGITVQQFKTPSTFC